MYSNPSGKSTILYPYAAYYFALALILTWIGFSQSYFARLTQVSIYHHLHVAIARLLFLIPWFNNFDKALNVAYGIIVVILGMLIYDYHKKGKIYPTYLIGLVLATIMLIGQNLVGDWQWWANWMAAYAAL